ncbi:hypothetical protein FSP39_002167 [Pinctada imbricata]|uniref:Uncharacterized protein n=1 Tax=Pinctada imbricata TaxID=66713 RepID=A0AA89BR33_PINIB|nr:hypothetical protein FSP39_002167 [Pinctada imbricata]
MMEGMLELLSTTDAAVKALDKSSSHPTSSRGSGRQTDRDKTEPSHDSGIVRSEQKTHPSEPYQPVTGREVWDRSSDESTTASDVLIRSTLGDPHEKSLLEGKSVQEEAANDASSVSKCSRSSYGMDNFNSSGPQKVKISTKKLREIKSPYESPRDGVQITDGNGKPLNGAPGQLSTQRSQDSSARSSPLNSARSSQRSVGVDRSQNSVGSKHSSVEGSKHSSVAGSKHSSVAGSRPGSGGSSRHSVSSRTSGALHQGGASIQPRSGTGSHPSSVGGSRPQSGGSQRPSGSRPSSGTSARSAGSRQGHRISMQEKMQTSVSSATVTNNPKDIITLQSTPQGKKTMSRVFPQANGIKDVDTHTHSPPVHDTDVDSAKPVFIERHTPPKKTSSAINHVDDDDDRFAFDMLQKKLDLSFDSGKQVSNENSIQSATSSQPEIVTVPERIVTVSARNSVSTDNSVSDVGSENVETIVEKVITISSQPPMSDEVSSSGEQSESLDEKIPPALLDRFLHGNKNQGPSLKQGSQMDGVTAPDKKSSDIMVSDFKLSEKQRLIKESFAKRFEQGGPKKRVIQPKIIGNQRQSREVDTRQPSNAPNNQTTEAVTAAVAASAAIAVTQPFLKAQQELESKMANILGKIAELHSNKPEQQESGREQQKVSELENRLADLTEQRIKQLESQVAMQAQLLSMSRNPQDVQSIPLSQSRSRSPVIRSPSRSPPRSPPRSPQMQRKTEPSKTAVTKTKFIRPSQTGKRPDYDEWRKIHKADSEPQLQSPLDTPNPRSRAPKPVAYEALKEKKCECSEHLM